MFFFFVGGLEQQAGWVLRESTGSCVRCGSFYCRDCSFLFPRSLLPRPSSAADDGQGGFLDEDARRPSVPDTRRCYDCDRVVEPHFRFCPFCGAAL